MGTWVLFASVLSVSACVYKERVYACCIHVCVPVGVQAQSHVAWTWGHGAVAASPLPGSWI